jgi:hypothetical protein
MIVDYQVAFIWPVMIVGAAWTLLFGNPLQWYFGTPVFAFGSYTTLDWVLTLLPSANFAAVVRGGLFWGPAVLFLVFWLRRYRLALRAVRWANF